MKSEERQFEFLDILNIISFIVGLQNVSLNEKQIASLDEHLKAQDDILLNKIINQNEEIINLLKEIEACTRN